MTGRLAARVTTARNMEEDRLIMMTYNISRGVEVFGRDCSQGANYPFVLSSPTCLGVYFSRCCFQQAERSALVSYASHVFVMPPSHASIFHYENSFRTLGYL
jgi:hypothetical protein